MNKVFCRIFQGGMKVGMYFLPWHIPELIEGRVPVNRSQEI